MVEFDVQLPAQVNLASVAVVVKEACTEAGLTQTLSATLARFPGSRHWHFRKGRARGTLEITLWPAQRRLWLKVARGREGAWMEAALPRLRRALAAALTAPNVLVDQAHEER